MVFLDCPGVSCGNQMHPFIFVVNSFYFSTGTESSSQVWWVSNFKFSKREKHSGCAIKTIYKKLNRGMLKHIPLNQKSKSEP